MAALVPESHSDAGAVLNGRRGPKLIGDAHSSAVRCVLHEHLTLIRPTALDLRPNLALSSVSYGRRAMAVPEAEGGAEVPVAEAVDLEATFIFPDATLGAAYGRTGTDPGLAIE